MEQTATHLPEVLSVQRDPFGCELPQSINQ